MRNGTIVLKLSYPIRIGFMTFWTKRKIGFSFDQRALFNLLVNNDIDLPNHSDWMKKTPQGIVVSETVFASAQSYRENLRKKDNFTKEGLTKALNESKEQLEKIIQCWTDSEQLGFKKMPGKKKVAKR